LIQPMANSHAIYSGKNEVVAARTRFLKNDRNLVDPVTLDNGTSTKTSEFL